MDRSPAPAPLLVLLFIACVAMPLASVPTAHAFSSPQGAGAVVIFCHGSGDTGPGARSYVEGVAPAERLAALADAGVAFEYPTAVPRPYRLYGNRITSVWFDRRGGMDPRYREDTESVEASAERLNGLIDELVEGGVSPGKIALGGFSMGGGIALQTAARSEHELGAVFAMSSYLCNDSWVWTQLPLPGECNAAGTGDGREKGNALLKSPIYMAHGEADTFVFPAWGEDTAKRLREGGADVRDFVRIPNLGHEMSEMELAGLFDFLLERLSIDEKSRSTAPSGQRSVQPNLLFENDRVRVSDFRLSPGSEARISTDFPTVRWQVGAGTHELIADTHRKQVQEVPDKTVMFHEHGANLQIRNVGDAVYRQVWFELLRPPKRTDEETEKLLANAIYTTDVGTELLFENEYCRCWDFYLEPGGGDPKKPHHHVLDYCFVYVAKGRLLGYSHTGEPGLFDSINEDGDVTWFDIPDEAYRDPNQAHGGKNGYSDRPMREYLVELK